MKKTKLVKSQRRLFVCKRCKPEYEWFSRNENPTLCPNCHSAYWNKEKKIGIKKKRMENVLLEVNK